MTHKNSHSAPATDWEASWRNDPTARLGHPSVRFEEGLGWDTDVPNEFLLGVRQGYGEQDAGGGHNYTSVQSDSTPRANQNLNVFTKPADETMRERGHVGSASWVDSPAQLGSFVQGASDDARGSQYGAADYAHEQRSGTHYSRPSHARVED